MTKIENPPLNDGYLYPSANLLDVHVKNPPFGLKQGNLGLMFFGLNFSFDGLTCEWEHILPFSQVCKWIHQR